MKVVVQRYKHLPLPIFLTLKTLTLLFLFTFLFIINSLHSGNSMNFHFPSLGNFQPPSRQFDTDFGIFWSSLMFQWDEFRGFGVISVIKEEFLSGEEIGFGVHADSVDTIYKANFGETVGIFAGMVYKAEFVCRAGCVDDLICQGSVFARRE